MPELSALPIGSDPVIRFAAAELARYIERLTGCPVAVRPRAKHGAEGGIWLGVSADLPEAPVPAVRDARWDDAISVSVAGTCGAIAGSNPRSVLLGVYRYLACLGCRWVRPGPDGEYVPSRSSDDLSASYAHAASYRHRGICIEGAVSYEHVRDIIEWAPRVGYNAYFTQFREAFTFFDRWYSRLGNPTRVPEPLTVDRARELTRRAAADAKERGLMYHAVGHGWTCEPFGVAGLGWDYDQGAPTPEIAPYLADVSGERAYAPGGPLNTNLCYSNPEARRKMVAEVARYACDHPEVDLLHLWLADGANNQCECGACRGRRPADWYVTLLNEVDAELTARGVETRVVFLIYVDLLWPPETERLRNPGRFVLMFAPITRSYTRAFSPSGVQAGVQPYTRNKLQFPRSVDENVAYLRAWQETFRGDSFDFDYHLMWDHYNDPGYIASARVAHEDGRRLADIGLDGLVSCQTQRAFLPTGLPGYALGAALWDKASDFDAVARDYCDAAFGASGADALRYLTALSDLFDPPYQRGEKPGSDAVAAGQLEQVAPVVQAFRPTIEVGAMAANPCHAASWRYLRHHADLCERLAPAMAARARGDRQSAARAWEGVRDLVREREDTLHPVLDVWLFQATLGGRFRAE